METSVQLYILRHGISLRQPQLFLKILLHPYQRCISNAMYGQTRSLHFQHCTDGIDMVHIYKGGFCYKGTTIRHEINQPIVTHTGNCAANGGSAGMHCPGQVLFDNSVTRKQFFRDDLFSDIIINLLHRGTSCHIIHTLFCIHLPI